MALIMTKTVTISARIAQEDVAFLGQLSIENAKTPSDKFRAIISEARRRHENQQDFRGCLTMIQDMITPVGTHVRETELVEQKHSELVSRTLEWLPDTMAFIISIDAMKQGAIDREQLTQLENGLADRVFRLIESTLQLAVTQRSPCYDPSAMHSRVEPILDLLKAINVTQNSDNYKEEL